MWGRAARSDVIVAHVESDNNVGQGNQHIKRNSTQMTQISLIYAEKALLIGENLRHLRAILLFAVALTLARLPAWDSRLYYTI